MHRRNAGQIRSWMATEDPTRRDRVSTRVCVCESERERAGACQSADMRVCMHMFTCMLMYVYAGQAYGFMHLRE